MDRWVGKVALITGASAGIGKAIAEKFVKAGIVVAGFARRADRLALIEESLRNEKGAFHGFVCDVTKEDDFKAKLEEIANKIGPVHILVNNAGILKCGQLIEQPTETWREILETNVIAVSVICREVTTMMRKHKIAGHIINLNSIAGHYVPRLSNKIPPMMGMYPSTKHAITAITDTLRQELDYYKTGIKVTSISPGYVKTEIFNEQPKNELFNSTTPIPAPDQPPYLESEDVADAVMYIISTPPKVQVYELTIRPLEEDF